MRNSERDWVYVVEEIDGDFIKVGVTYNPWQRLQGLQGSNPRPLALVCAWRGDLEVEALLHQAIARFHVRGEWFRREALAVIESDPILVGRTKIDPRPVRDLIDDALRVA